MLLRWWWGGAAITLSLSLGPCREREGQRLTFWLWPRQHAALASKRNIHSLWHALKRSTAPLFSSAPSPSPCQICLHGGSLKSPGEDESKDRTSPASPASCRRLRSSRFYEHDEVTEERAPPLAKGSTTSGFAATLRGEATSLKATPSFCDHWGLSLICATCWSRRGAFFLPRFLDAASLWICTRWR